MAAEDELKDIKQILGQIRDQNQTTAGVGSQSSRDLAQYTSELKMARQELELLDEGSGAYNRKLREIEKLTAQARNAMKDQRRETDLLTLSMQGVTGAVDMLGNAVDKVIVKFGELVASVMAEAKQLDNLTVQFKAATGASSQMAGNIGLLTDRLRMFGVSSEEASESIGALYGGFNLFTRLNQDQQQQLGTTVALLGELGISAQTSAKILETSMMAMGMSVEQSTTLLMDLRGTAQALQVPIEQLSSDFLAAENRIVQLGVRGPDAFKKLAAQSKATGVDVSTLLGVVQQFDTFEGAAKAASKLGAVLGTSVFDPLAINQLESPADQIEYLKDGIHNAGITADNFSEQSRFLQKAIAGALGTDTTTMVKILRGEFDELNEAAQEATMTFEEMKKEAFGLKGFDEVVNNMMGALKRPISDIQKATRATFEGLTPLISRFEKFNARLIEQTTSFVEKNSQLVGAVGILYNLANIDGIQQGYDIFKGIASFTGSVMSNLFSIKGVLAVMVGGTFYLLRERLGGIYDILTGTGPGTGPVAALKALGAAMSDVFDDFKQKAIDLGFDKEFFSALSDLVFNAFYFGILKVTDYMAPLYDKMKVEFLYMYQEMEVDGTLEKAGEILGKVFTKALQAIPVIGKLFGLNYAGMAGVAAGAIKGGMMGVAGGPAGILAGAAIGGATVGFAGQQLGNVAQYADRAIGFGPEEKQRKSKEQFALEVAAQRAMSDKDIAIRLAKQRQVLSDSYDVYSGTRGAATVDAQVAKVTRKIDAMAPHIADMKRESKKIIDATQRQARQAFADGMDLGREMGAAAVRGHEELRRPVVLEADGRELARIMDPVATNAVGKRMTGRK